MAGFGPLPRSSAACWPLIWLGVPVLQSDLSGAAAAWLIRQISTLEFTLAMGCAEEIRRKYKAGTLHPQQFSMAILNDRYILWDDEPGRVYDAALCQICDSQIDRLPAKIVRYNAAGHEGALHADKPADSTPEPNDIPAGTPQ